MVTGHRIHEPRGCADKKIAELDLFGLPSPIMSESPMQLPDVAHKLCGLPLVLPVAARIRHALDSHADSSTLLRLFALEPAIAAELLVAANSPEYGFASRIYTVKEAVRMLGWEHAQLLVSEILSAAQPVDVRKDAIIQASWIHSLASAFFAGEMALFFGVPEDRAHAIGLMHNIGRLGLLSAFPNQYLELMEHRYHTLAEFLEAEERAVGMNHAKAGLSLSRSWGLPEEFTLAAGEHHDACADQNSAVSAMVRLACRLAHTSGFPAEPCDPASLPEPEADLETPLDQVLNEVQANGLAKLWERIDPFWHAMEFNLQVKRR
jgi:HD-like signal output (HDOD) protein